jgi:hypothetical protein
MRLPGQSLKKSTQCSSKVSSSSPGNGDVPELSETSSFRSCERGPKMRSRRTHHEYKSCTSKKKDKHHTCMNRCPLHGNDIERLFKAVHLWTAVLSADLSQDTRRKKASILGWSRLGGFRNTSVQSTARSGSQEYSVVRMKSIQSTTALGFSASCQLPRKEVSLEGLPKTPSGNKFRLWRSTNGQMMWVCATKEQSGTRSSDKVAHDHLYVTLTSLVWNPSRKSMLLKTSCIRSLSKHYYQWC